MAILSRAQTKSWLFSFLLIISFGAKAQWFQSYNNNFSGSVFTLASENGNLYSGTPYGVFKLSSNSSKWSQFSSGLSMDGTGGQINCFLVDGTNIFVGMLNGIFKSPTGTATWQPSSVGIPVYAAISKLIRAGNTLFAGTEGYGIYRSLDDGATWNAVNNGLPVKSFLFISSIFSVGTDLYAGTQADGIFKSVDNGDSWTAVNNGMPTSNNQVNCFAVSGSKIFAGTYQGAFLSLDGGALWTMVSSGIPLNSNVNALLIDGNTLYAATFDHGVYISSNEGTSWNPSGFTVTPSTFAFAKIDNTLFVACGQGVFASTDGGASWKSKNSQLNNLLVYSLITEGDSLVVGTDAGGVILSKGDSSWVRITSGPRYANSFMAAGKNDFYFSTGTDNHHLYYNGTSWTETSAIEFNTYSLYYYGNKLFAGENEAISVSTDHGATWSASDAGMPSNYYVKCFTSNQSTLFAGTNLGVYMSVDNGQSWNSSNNGLPNYCVVNTLFVSDNKLYAGTEFYGIFVSKDNGKSWNASSNGVSLANGLEVRAFATFSSLLFAGTNKGVYYSRDQGNSWTIFNDGMVNSDIYSLSVCRSKLYAGTVNWIWSRPFADLNIPTATAATFISTSGFKANWRRVAGANSYQLDISSDNFNSFVTNYQGMQVADTSQIITGLNAGTVYQFRVRAVVGLITSPSSNVISTITLPPPPVALLATNITSNSFLANWHKALSATGYLFDVSTDNFTTFVSGYSSKAVNDTSFNVLSLPPGTSFQYRVRAVNASGISSNSNIISSVVTGDIEPLQDRSLYPNPVRDYFFISGFQGASVASSIFDLVGRSSPVKPVSNHHLLEYDVREFPNGIYIVQVEENGKVSQFKFVKY